MCFESLRQANFSVDHCGRVEMTVVARVPKVRAGRVEDEGEEEVMAMRNWMVIVR